MRDRIVEFPNRYKLIPVSGDIYDLTPEPGIVTEQGTPLNKATLLSDQTANVLGLDTDTATVDEALGAAIPTKFNNIIFKRIQTITTSQNWVVPEGIGSIDVFLVNGGHNGEGTKGGDGGACIFIPNLRVVSGAYIPILIGAAGGATSFGTFTPLSSAPGGEGGTSGTTGLDGGNGALPTYGGLGGAKCPLDGNLYGVSGAGGSGARTSMETIDVARGGIAGAPPTGGGRVYANTQNSSGKRYSGASGASYDNNGRDGIVIPNSGSGVAPKGGDATTYGCGGGGGGARNGDNMTGGEGGAGAPGVCIIAY